MKKKVMSEEALAVMLADGEAPVEELDVVETTAAEADANIAVEEEGEEEEVKATEEEEVVEPTALETLTEEFDAHKVESADTIAGLEASLVETVGKLEAAEVSFTELKAIVVGQISKMRMVLKVAAVDMTDWKAGAIVAEYATSSEAFTKALPVGSVIPEDTNTIVESPGKSSLDVSNADALGFK